MKSVEKITVLHAYPEDDIYPHSMETHEGNCWCQPYLDWDLLEKTGDFLWIHRPKISTWLN